MNSTTGIVILAAVLLAIIISAGVFTKKGLNSASEELEAGIIRIEKSAGSQDWPKATEDLNYLQKYWSKTEKSWTMLLDHFEIDNIDTALSKMTRFIELKESSLALAEAAILKQYIKHIPEKEAFDIKNIL